jgi:nucleoside-diphosphate-sugar epimerase
VTDDGRRVLIAGCGDLGTEVGLRLAAAGHTVWGLRRSVDVLPPPIRPLAGDLAVDGGLPRLPEGLDLVVHTPAGARGAAAYRAVYHDGLGRLLDELARVGGSPERVLFVSATSVYGVTDGSWVDEDTPTEPTSDTGAVLVATERLLAEASVPGVSLRLAGIYGPGRTRLIDQVRDGRAVRPDPPVHTNRIHRDDAAAAVVHLLTAVDRAAPAYIGVDDEPADKGEVLCFLADELGLPHPPLAGGDDQGRSRGGDKRCRNDRLRATGWAPTYPTYREGYRAILAGAGHRHP